MIEFDIDMLGEPSLLSCNGNKCVNQLSIILWTTGVSKSSGYIEYLL